jgi:hypothetical protein
MRRYAWAISLGLVFFGALPGIQSTVSWIGSRTMTNNSWALIYWKFDCLLVN